MSLKNRIFHKKGNIAIFVLSFFVYAAVRSAFNINPNDIIVVFPIVWVAVWIKCMAFVVTFYVFDRVWEFLKKEFKEVIVDTNNENKKGGS